MTMLVLMLDQYIYPPHRHTWKDETYFIVKGNCNFIEYTPSGDSVRSQFLVEGSFLVNESRSFHTLQPISDLFAFIEHTTGPFLNNKLEFLN